MTLLTILHRTELEHDFESAVHRCGIDSPQSRRALKGLLEQHPSLASVRVYKPGVAKGGVGLRNCHWETRDELRVTNKRVNATVADSNGSQKMGN